MFGLVHGDPVGLGLSHLIPPSRGIYHTRLSKARSHATGQVCLLFLFGDQIHELHGTGVKSASLDYLQIFSELLEKHDLVFALWVFCVHENGTEVYHYITYTDVVHTQRK